MISEALRAAINALHQAIGEEPDPADKSVLAQCLRQMLQVQAKNMAEQNGQGQGPTAGQPQQAGGPDRRQALLAGLTGGP